MKIIGLVTPTKVKNYGTKLQAFAMQEIFRERGFHTEILFFLNRKGFLSKYKYYIKAIVQKRFCSYFQKRQYNNYIEENYADIPLPSIYESLKKRMTSIDSIDNLYHFKQFIDKRSLKKYTKRYAAVVCGSDQIWHPILNRSEFWTLQLIDDSVRRISYAPSLGVDEMPEEAKTFFKKNLFKFYSISVREISGVKLLQELTDNPIKVVLDPTLLVGRKVWDKFKIDKPMLTDRNYCLCYLLGTNANHRKVVSDIADKLNLSIYNFSHFKKYNDADEQLCGEHLYDISPAEFVGLICRAKFVVTDSFHCSAFAIMYHIPFITLLRYEDVDGMSTNNRIYSLLEQFGLGSRIYTKNKKLEDIISSKIDYKTVEDILSQKRNESNAFIDEALSGI